MQQDDNTWVVWVESLKWRLGVWMIFRVEVVCVMLDWIGLADGEWGIADNKERNRKTG
jgi:hypothetical protein